MALTISVIIMNKELKEHLMLLAERYETPAFITEDPIQIPHRYTSQVDIEISGLVTSWIATGNRKAIIKSADRVDCELFSCAPHSYIMSEEWKIYAGQREVFTDIILMMIFICCVVPYMRCILKPRHWKIIFMSPLKDSHHYKDYNQFWGISTVCPQYVVLPKPRKCVCFCAG